MYEMMAYRRSAPAEETHRQAGLQYWAPEEDPLQAEAHRNSVSTRLSALTNEPHDGKRLAVKQYQVRAPGLGQVLQRQAQQELVLLVLRH